MFNLKRVSIGKLLLFFLFCCGCSDYTERLGSGYFFVKEGGSLNEIYCEKPFGGRIPATVIDYDYNNDFIIAKQKPKIPQSILYEKKYEYKYGLNEYYYWLIIKDEYSVLGPYSISEFNEAKEVYGIPNTLELK